MKNATIYGVQFLSGGRWRASNMTFEFSRDGRSNGYGLVPMGRPTAWAQCAFPSLRHSGQWRAVKL